MKEILEALYSTKMEMQELKIKADRLQEQLIREILDKGDVALLSINYARLERVLECRAYEAQSPKTYR